MGKKPIIHDNSPEEEVHIATVSGSLVEDIASKADLDSIGEQSLP